MVWHGMVWSGTLSGFASCRVACSNSSRLFSRQAVSAQRYSVSWYRGLYKGSLLGEATCCSLVLHEPTSPALASRLLVEAACWDSVSALLEGKMRACNWYLSRSTSPAPPGLHEPCGLGPHLLGPLPGRLGLPLGGMEQMVPVPGSHRSLQSSPRGRRGRPVGGSA